MTMDEDDDVHAAAIDWWVREKAGELHGDVGAAFDAWLAANPAHRRAYADIAGMFEEARALRPARRPRPLGAWAWRTATAGLLAASVALFAFVDDLAILWQADYAAGVGERRTVILADGSRVELDAGSAISVGFEAGRRRVRLLSGEAWFEVASDSARPFVVEAAGGEVTALGTAFDVALAKQNSARVAVGEHAVSVTSGGSRVIVEARQQTSYEADAPARQPASVAEEAIASWRRGALIIEDQPLSEALATLGRHHHGYIFCLRASTCARRVSGVFSTAEPLGALREIEYFLGLHSVHLTDHLILLTD
jgi:transmembrane sensor